MNLDALKDKSQNKTLDNSLLAFANLDPRQDTGQSASLVQTINAKEGTN
jgi:hypothetical protein